MEETINHLDFLISQTEEIINHYNKEQIRTIQFFYLGLCERLNAACKSLKLLVSAVEEDQNHEFSAGLVVRTLLLDFLIGLRGYDILKQGQVQKKDANGIQTELTEYCNIILADGAAYALRHFRAFHDAGAITEQQLHEVYANMSRNYARFLEPYQNDGVMPPSRFPRAPQVRELFTLLSAGTQELKALAKNYDTYSFYSKYEHFNILSFDLMRRLEPDQRSTLIKSIELLVLHLFISIQVILDTSPDGYLNNQIKVIGEYLTHDVLKQPRATYRKN